MVAVFSSCQIPILSGFNTSLSKVDAKNSYDLLYLSRF